MARSIRIGTRQSNLARWQAEWCADQLVQQGYSVELVLLETQGDVTVGSLAAAGGTGLFTKRIQQALLDDEADLAVHSLKDLPTVAHPDLELAAVPIREDSADAWVSPHATTVAELPPGSIVGTGSIRRQAQVLNANPQLQVHDIRGNVETRLGKLDSGEFQAIVLACAGLRRLKFEDRITWRLPDEIMLPAVGQGALGIEIRRGDDAARAAAEMLIDRDSMNAVLAERALLRELEAGCLAPVGCRADVIAQDGQQQLQLKAVVLDAQGKQRLDYLGTGDFEHPEALGEQAARELLAQGAAQLIGDARRQKD